MTVKKPIGYETASKVWTGVRSLKNRLLNLLDSPVVVLLYHRVTKPVTDPQLLAVWPENFREQMRFLKASFPVVRFEEDWATVKEPSVAVTFDDGYADNFLEALPILKEVGVPATFFVSTGNLGTFREYWWDELERLILNDGSFPASFTLEDKLFGQTFATAAPPQRQAFYRKLHPLMMLIAPPKREEWFRQLRQWAGADETGRAAQRPMSYEELRLLAESDWVTIGAHTANHSPLSALAEEQQRYEIITSKQDLEKAVGRGIKTFSYPFGSRTDYNRTSIRICREAGFAKVASNFPGQAHGWTDPYQIPRHLVRNWAPDIFARKLKTFWTR